MNIRWTPEAANDLEGICLYIAGDNRDAAVRATRSIFQKLEQLAAFPQRGRIASANGARELILSPLPYVAVYRVTENAVEILRIWHGAQDRH